MNILAKLPYDLQEKVLEEYLKCEALRALVKNYPIEFTMAMQGEILLREELIKRDFFFSTHIWCDEQNLVKANFTIAWSSWTGWSYNLRNVPLGFINEHNCLEIVKRWKRAFYEYVRLNYTFGKRSFENAVSDGYKVISFSVPQDSLNKIHLSKLKSKALAKVVKRAWFNLNVDQIRPLEFKLKGIDNQDNWSNVNDGDIERFRMDDSCPDLGSDFIRVPYTGDDLELVKKQMPFIYKCLEDNDELWSPKIEFSPGMKKYINLYNWYNDRFQTLPPPEKFNQMVYDVIHKDLDVGWCSLSYDYHTKYVVLPKIHEVLNWCA